MLLSPHVSSGQGISTQGLLTGNALASGKDTSNRWLFPEALQSSPVMAGEGAVSLHLCGGIALHRGQLWLCSCSS